MENKKIIKIILALLIALFVFGGVWLYKNFHLTSGGLEPRGEFSSDLKSFIDGSKELSTNDWSVYTNRRYGYELKYPKDSFVFKSGDGGAEFRFHSDHDVSSVFEIHTKPLNSPNQKKDIGQVFLVDGLHPETITFVGGGWEGGCSDCGDTLITQTVLEKNGKVFTVRFVRDGNLTPDSVMSTFAAMLQTFRFLDDTAVVSSAPADTGEWETYASRKFRYSFAFPSDWTVVSGSEYAPCEEEPCSSTVGVSASNGNSIMISVFERSTIVGESARRNETCIDSDFSFAGYAAKKCFDEEFPEEFTYDFERNGSVFSVSQFTAEESDRQNLEKAFQKLIETFRFD